MKNISYSAPGSMIFAGEYTMLFGKPALASAVNFHTTASCSKKTMISEDTTTQYIGKEVEGTKIKGEESESARPRLKS